MMKRWISVLFVLLAGIAKAQMLVPFTPRTAGALDAVFREAEQRGLQNPELQGVITVSGDFEFQNTPISLAFDLETGKAIVWVYAVAGQVGAIDSLMFIPLARLPLVGFTPVPLPIPSLPVPLTNPVDSDWMDTDEMLQYLQNDGVYQAFRQAYPDSIPDVVWLSKVLVPVPSTQWSLQWIGSDLATSMLCRVNALVGTTQCVAIPVGVKAPQYDQADVAVFPNPAHNVLLIRAALPSPLLRIELFTAYGASVPTFRPIPNGGDSDFVASVAHLPRGMYYLIVQTVDQQYQFPVVLQ